MKFISSRAGFLALVVATLICLPFRSHAAYDMFLSFTGVTGEATNGLIAIESIQWGVGRGISSATGGGPRQASLPSFSEVTISKTMDSASPQLAFQAAGGNTEVTCVLTINDRNTGNTLYTLTLTGVLISGYSVSSGGDRPSESLSLNYTKITWSYQKLDNAGNKVGNASSPLGWDLVTQKPVQ